MKINKAKRMKRRIKKASRTRALQLKQRKDSKKIRARKEKVRRNRSKARYLASKKNG